MEDENMFYDALRVKDTEILRLQESGRRFLNEKFDLKEENIKLKKRIETLRDNNALIKENDELRKQLNKSQEELKTFKSNAHDFVIGLGMEIEKFEREMASDRRSLENINRKLFGDRKTVEEELEAESKAIEKEFNQASESFIQSFCPICKSKPCRCRRGE